MDALSPTPPGRPTDRSADMAALWAKVAKLEQENARWSGSFSSPDGW